jgi:hypothetical protein
MERNERIRFKLIKMKALSPLISMIMVIAFSVIAIIIVMNSLAPTIEKARVSAIISEATQNLQLLNSLIKEVASESKGSKRTISISITDGIYYIDDDKNYLYFEFKPSEQIKLGGKKGDIDIVTGLNFSEYFNNYVEGSNASSTWNILSGNWSISSGRYKGVNGLAYKSIGTLENFHLSGEIYGEGDVIGEIFILPKNPNNLIGYWTFDESTGNITYDFSFNSNNGTLYDDYHENSDGNTLPKRVEGKFSNALEFDGTDDYVDFTNNSIFDLGLGSFTISFWIKPYIQASENPRILEYGGYLSNGWSIQISNSTKTIVFYYCSYDGYSGEFAPQISYTENDWNYIAVSVNTSSGKGRSYKNGIFIAEKLIPTYYSNNSAKLLLGKPGYFNGTIDEIKIYNTALNDNEIFQDYILGLKKLNESKTIKIENQTNVFLALSSPKTTYFDNIKISREERTIRMIIPYTKIDLFSFERISKGTHNIVIENLGLNSTTNKIMIKIKVE